MIGSGGCAEESHLLRFAWVAIGVGAIAARVAREILKGPIVITMMSRPVTTAFRRDMGAIYIVEYVVVVPTTLSFPAAGLT